LSQDKKRKRLGNEARSRREAGRAAGCTPIKCRIAGCLPRYNQTCSIQLGVKGHDVCSGEKKDEGKHGLSSAAARYGAKKGELSPTPNALHEERKRSRPSRKRQKLKASFTSNQRQITTVAREPRPTPHGRRRKKGEPEGSM